MDSFNKYAQQRLREAFERQQASRIKQAYTPPPPPPRRATGSSPAPRPASPSRQATGRPAYVPPPPPTISDLVTSNLRQRVTAPSPAPAPTPSNNIIPAADRFRARMAERAAIESIQTSDTPYQVAQDAPEEPESWTLWESPDGTDVVAPSSYTGPDGWTEKETITDPEAIANAQASPMAYDNQPTEIRVQFTRSDLMGTQADDQLGTTDRRTGPIFNDGQTPIWMADDQARQAEEQANEAAGNRVVTDRLKRAARPITIASDFARQQEEAQTAQTVAQRLREQVDAEAAQQPVAPTTPAQPAVPAADQYVVLRSPEGIVRALPAADMQDEQYATLFADWTPVGGVVDAETAEAINANEALMQGDTFTGAETGDERQVTPRVVYPQEVENAWSDAWDTVTDWYESDVQPIAESTLGDIWNDIRGGNISPISVAVDVARGILQVPGTINWPDDFGGVFTGSLAIADMAIQQVRNGEFGPIPEGALDAVDWVLNTPIPVPGTDADPTLREVFTTLLNKPAEYTVQQTVDAWYERQTGNDVGGDGLLAQGAAGFGDTAIQITTLPEWLGSNPDRAVQIYEQGVDVDGDGTVDLTGSDAVMHVYREETGAWNSFVFDIATDPYNLLIVTGGGGALARRAGTSLLARPGASRATRAAGRLLEVAGAGAERGSRILEGAGTAGLEFAPDLIQAGLRRTPGVRRLLADSAEQRVRNAVEGFDGAAPSGLRVAEDGFDVVRNEAGAITAVRMPSGATRAIPPAQAENLARELDPALSPRPEVQDGVRALNAAGIDASAVPPRFVRPLVDILEANPGRSADIAEVVPTLTPALRQHVVAMDAGFGHGRSFPDAALDTSAFVRDTFRPAFGEGFTFPDFVASTPRQSAAHTLAETIIHTAWDSAENRAARSQLYRMVGTNDAVRKTLPANPTDAQIAQAERYAALVEEHAAWHPALYDDPSFAPILKEAEDIRRQLADLGVTPRRRYGLRAAPTPTPSVTPASRNPEQLPNMVPLESNAYEAPTIAPESPRTNETPDYDPVALDGEAHPRDRAAAEGIIERADILDPIARLYRWTEDDYREAVDILAGMKAEYDALPLTAAEVNTPAGRRYLNDLNGVIDRRRALTLQHDIAARSPVGSKVANGAQKKAAQLTRDLTTMERKLGVRADGTGGARIRKSKHIIPDEKSKAAKQYARDVERLTSKQPVSRSAFRRRNPTRFGLIADEGGMAYLSTPWGDLVLTPEQLAELTRYTLENGDTTLDRWVKHINALSGNKRLAPDEVIERARLQTRADLEERLRELNPQREPTAFGRAWDTYTQFLRDSILGSWLNAVRYLTNTTLGNASNLVIGGYGADVWRVFNARQVNRNAQDVRRTAALVEADPFTYRPDVMVSDRIANTFGTPHAPEVRRQVRTDTRVDEGTVMERWFDRHQWPKSVKRIVGGLWTGDSRVLRQAQGMDMAMRDAVYGTAWNREIKGAIGDFRDAATDRLRAAGFADAEITDVLDAFRRQYPDGFSMADVQAHFRQHLPDGVADRLGRDWQSAINRVHNHARTEVTRVTFAGRETNLDTVTRRYVMFAYFMSRQYNFLMRQGLRHPGLINAYQSYQEFVDAYLEENPDLPEWMRGMIRITGLPGGTSLHVMPHALWEIGTLFQNPDEFDSSLMEQVFLENPFIFFHPGVTSILNIGGWLGDARDVDPFNTHTLGRYIQFGENLLRYAGLIEDTDLAGNRSDDAWNQVRDWVSGKLDWLPGAEQVDFVESADQENSELRAIAWDEAEKMGLDPTDPEIAAWIEDQMADPTSDLYKRSLGRYLWSEGIGLLAKVVPGVAGLRPITRQTDVGGEDLMNTLSDEAKNFARTPDPAVRAMFRQMDEFYSIDDTYLGTMTGQIYTDIVYGTPSRSVFLDGREYTPDDILAMDTEQRKDLARALFAETGTLDEWQAVQDAEGQFLSQPENREFAQYRTWSGEVREYGIDQYWEDVIQHNPNARRYYEGLDLENMTDAEREQALTGTWAFMAVAGHQPNIYQPEALETNFYDPVDVANTAPAPIPWEPYVSDWEADTRTQVSTYQREMAKADPVVRQIMVDWGINPDVPLNQIHYRTRYDIMDEYERRTGDRIPYEQADGYYLANLYFQWADAQPAGADTSLDAYFAQSDATYEANMPEAFNADQDAAEDTRSAYDLYDRSRNKDDGFRWEDEEP